MRFRTVDYLGDNPGRKIDRHEVGPIIGPTGNAQRHVGQFAVVAGVKAVFKDRDHPRQQVNAVELCRVTGVRIAYQKARPEDGEAAPRMPCPSGKKPLGEPLASFISGLECRGAAVKDFADVAGKGAADIRSADCMDAVDAVPFCPLDEPTSAPDIGVRRLSVAIGKKLKAGSTGENLAYTGRTLQRQLVRQRALDNVDLAGLHGFREIDAEGIHLAHQPVAGVGQTWSKHHHHAAVAAQKLT